MYQAWAVIGDPILMLDLNAESEMVLLHLSMANYLIGLSKSHFLYSSCCTAKDLTYGQIKYEQ